MRPNKICALLVATLFLAGCRGQSGPKPQSLPKTDITIGDIALSVELARTEAQRSLGMMHRAAIGENEGMLFVFPEPRVLSFYMKNTLVPLSIAFIRENGTIDRIARMTPHRLESHQSDTLCLYALEMPQGWFKQHAVKEGMKVTIPAEVKAEDY